MSKYITLRSLKNGDRAIIVDLHTEASSLRRKLIDMGITPGAEVIMKSIAPLGDPMKINIRGYELSLRKAEAEAISVQKIK